MRAPSRSTLRALCGTIALALAIAASGCKKDHSSAVDDLDPEGLNDPSIVVALGDSITFGVMDMGVETCDDSSRGSIGFTPPLAALSGKTVINAGICGEDSFGGVNRINNILHRFHPSVILIDYSPNDIDSGPRGNVSNLRLMIDAALKNHTVPIIGTLVPSAGEHAGWEVYSEAVNPMILDLCSEMGVECADHHKAFEDDAGFQSSPFALLSEDGLHPNHAGYALMADTWNKRLRRVY